MGPLAGVRILEIAGLGPGPFCAMLLADMGADVIRVDRPGAARGLGAMGTSAEILNRGRRSIGIDLKKETGVDVVLRLIDETDGLIEGFRPGVMERLGLGPDVLCERNRRLVYGRMTGWGQDGPLAPTAGHDIDYIALTGVLGAIGRAGEPPVPPLNLIADFGGGGMLLAFGMVCGILEAGRSGQGQVIDAAMVDGSAVLSTMMWSMANMGAWDLERKGKNLLDGAAPFYDTYRTSDGHWMAVGALEPQFYQQLLMGLGLEGEELPPQLDRSQWPRLREVFAERFATKTRAEWTATFENTDACVAPVLNFVEAAKHPHNAVRRTFLEVDGVMQPAPAPRFSRTSPSTPKPPVEAGTDSREILTALGLTAHAIDTLQSDGVVS